MRPSDSELATLIRDERPSIDEEFAAILDERAAKGFGRQDRATPLAALVDRLRAVPPRRILAPAGAVATLLVVVGVSITAVGGLGGGSGSSSSSDTSTPPLTSQPQASTGGGRGGRGTAKPARPTPSIGEYNLNQSSNAKPDAAQAASRTTAAPAFKKVVPAPAPRAPATRKVAQNANLTLSTDPDKVRTVATQVTEVVRRYHGLVISSQITSGKRGPAPRPLPETVPIGPSLGADFQLRIPASKVEPALDDLSGLGLVISRTEGSQDITRRFNSARDSIGNLVSERDTLIKQLAQATTPGAVHAIKHRLAVVRHQLARAQGKLGQLRERVAMVPVHVSVEARGAGAGGGGGGFGLDDAVHDAGRVLTVAAGVLLISLAVLAPLAVLGVLAWLFARSLARWRRERALSDSI